MKFIALIIAPLWVIATAAAAIYGALYLGPMPANTPAVVYANMLAFVGFEGLVGFFIGMSVLLWSETDEA